MNFLSLTREDLIRLQDVMERQVKLCEAIADKGNKEGVVDLNLVKYARWSSDMLKRIDDQILKGLHGASEFEYE